MAIEKDDRPPAIGLEMTVDSFGLHLHLIHELLVAPDMGAAGSAYLHKSEFALVGRIPLKKSFNGQKTFQDALGIVHAVHSHTQAKSIYAELPEQRVAFGHGG